MRQTIQSYWQSFKNFAYLNRAQRRDLFSAIDDGLICLVFTIRIQTFSNEENLEFMNVKNIFLTTSATAIASGCLTMFAGAVVDGTEIVASGLDYMVSGKSAQSQHTGRPSADRDLGTGCSQ